MTLSLVVVTVFTSISNDLYSADKRANLVFNGDAGFSGSMFSLISGSAMDLLGESIYGILERTRLLAGTLGTGSVLFEIVESDSRSQSDITAKQVTLIYGNRM